MYIYQEEKLLLSNLGNDFSSYKIYTKCAQLICYINASMWQWMLGNSLAEEEKNGIQEETEPGGEGNEKKANVTKSYNE